MPGFLPADLVPLGGDLSSYFVVTGGILVAKLRGAIQAVAARMSLIRAAGLLKRINNERS